MATAIKDMMEGMLQFRFNPSSIQRVVVKALTEVNNGEQPYFDATNPFAQALSASAVETAAFMEQHAAESRRRYPQLAQTQSDLYLHMSDADYINRFAVPAPANFKVRFYKPELLNGMVEEPETGYRKLTIPRNSYFTVAGVVFSMQYPVDIRLLSNGGLQITYDEDVPSPLQELETNSILYDILDGPDGEYVQFEVAVNQFSVKQRTEPISKTKDMVLNVEITDQFYHARVFHQNKLTGKWDELYTTHAKGIYDKDTPTAVLQLLDGVLRVEVPQIYINTNQLSAKIRVDVYETRGAINMQMDEYPGTAFSYTWRTYDSTEVNNRYAAALPNMNVAVFCDEHIINGRNEMPFEELRRNVINNAVGPIRQAVTTAQLETKLRNAGYDVVKYFDNVTNRVFLATREMPSPDIVTATTAASSGNKLLTAAAASIETLTISTDILAQMPAVINNLDSLTITPNLIYQIVNGMARPVDQAEVDRLALLPPDKRANEVTQGNYLYTPFHYVLDMSNNAFEIRPYYLDNPVAVSKVFVKQNDTTLMLIGTSAYGVFRTASGYKLRVQTRSDDLYKALPDGQVFAQLAYVPKGERDRAYLNGTLVGKTGTGERVFDFDLATTHNVDADDFMEMTQFTMYSTEPRITKTALTNSFDLIYSTSAILSPRWTPNEIDTVLGRHLLPNQIAGLNHEKVKIKFGEALDMLWSRARTVPAAMEYETWDADQQAFYTEDVFQYDDKGLRLSVVDGQVVYTYLHRVGDPILDGEGQITYAHRKGDLKRDSAGNPIPRFGKRNLERQIDLMLLEGVYWFATDATTTNYRTTLTNAVVGWLVNDLESFKADLLDKTRIYFYPKTTLGSINVLVDNDARKTIAAGQAFNVKLAVSKQVYDNINLRERLAATTVRVLSDQLRQKTVSVSQMIAALRSAYGDDVIDVQLSGLGGANNFPVATMVEETDRLSIRKRLVALADGKLAAEEDVTTVFSVHTT